MDSDQGAPTFTFIEGARKPPGVAVPLDGDDPAPEDLAYLPADAFRHDITDGRSQWPAGWYAVQEVKPDRDGNGGLVELRGCAGSCWRSLQLAGWTFDRLRLEADGQWHRAADRKYTMFPGESFVVESWDRDMTTEWGMWCRHNARVAFRPADATTGRDVYSDQTREEILSIFSLMRDGHCEAYHGGAYQVGGRVHKAGEYGWSDAHQAAQMLADRDNQIEAMRGIIAYLRNESMLASARCAGAAETVRRHDREVEEARGEVAELREALHVYMEPEPYLTCFFCGEGGGDVTLTSRGGVRPDPASSPGRVTQSAHRACLRDAAALRELRAERDRQAEARTDVNAALSTIAATLMDDRLGDEWLDCCDQRPVAEGVRALVDLAIGWRPVKRKFHLERLDRQRRRFHADIGGVFDFEAEPGRNVYLLVSQNIDPLDGRLSSATGALRQQGVQITLASVPTGVEVEAYELVPAESLDVVAQRPEPVDPRRCPYCGVVPQPGFRYCRGLARFLAMSDATQNYAPESYPERCG